MNECSGIRGQMAFYLDEELRGSERAAIATHLRDCPGCRELFDGERAFLKAMASARPLFLAPPELRDRVNTIVGDAPGPYKAPLALRCRLRLSFGGFPSSFRRPGAHWAVAAATMLSVFLAGIWEFARYMNQQHHDFASTAVDVHQRHLRGRMPLEVMADRPEQISAWFAGKVPFTLELPNYQESSAKEKRYRIQGARLVGYKNDYAAYVVYRMGERYIGLLATSGNAAKPSGGEEIVANGIAFHHDSIGGFKVITWSHRGLTYALVSDLDSPGQQSCLVCHERTNDFLRTPMPAT